VLEPPPTDCVPALVEPTAAAAPGVVVVAPDAPDVPAGVAPVALDFLVVELPPVDPELLAPVDVLPLLLLVPPLLLDAALLLLDDEATVVMGSGGGVAPTPRLPWNCGLAQLEAESVGGGCPVR
jgi:hypothetical protein